MALSTPQDPTFTLTTTTALTGIGVTSVVQGLDGSYFIHRYLSDGSGNGQGFQIVDSSFQLVFGPEGLNGYTSGFQQFGQSILLADGSVLSTWSGNGADTDGSGGVIGQITGIDGTVIKQDFVLNESTPGAQGEMPKLTATEAGFFAVWQDFTTYGSYNSVVGRFFDTSGTALTGDIRISENASVANILPEVARTSNGNVVVAWEENSQPFTNTGSAYFAQPGAISLQVVSASGVLLLPEATVSQPELTHAKEPEVIALTHGGFALVWHAATLASNSTVTTYLQYFDPYGVPTSAVVQVAQHETGSVASGYVEGETDIRYKIQLEGVGTQDGGVILLWDAIDPTTAISQLYLAKYDRYGALVGEVEMLPNPGNATRNAADLVLEADGSLSVFWNEPGGTMHVARYDVTSETHAEDLQVTGGAGGDSLSGGAGYDRIAGQGGNDTIDGGAGIDWLQGGGDGLPSGDDYLRGGDGADRIAPEDGADYALGDAGSDVFEMTADGVFAAGYVAWNVSGGLQTGTDARVSVEGLNRFDDVLDGGADFDTVLLTDGADALFLHDAFSSFHHDVSTATDSDGRQSAQRLAQIERIMAGAGSDIVDLTSADYSLAGQRIVVEGEAGDDTLWGSDADETLVGGAGEDALFGGAGSNVLMGGAGADSFQFTLSSSADRVADFDIAEGDRLVFFNTGGAVFDRSSAVLNTDGDVLTISHGSGTLSIELTDAGLQLGDLTSDVLVIV